MNTLVKVGQDLFEAPPDVLPVESEWQFEARDAGLEWNKEGPAWTGQGEFIQYHLWNSLFEIWIMRCDGRHYGGRIRYWLSFGPDHAMTQYDLSFDELREAVRAYLGGQYVE